MCEAMLRMSWWGRNAVGMMTEGLQRVVHDLDPRS